jgi:hypothetical protein
LCHQCGIVFVDETAREGRMSRPSRLPSVTLRYCATFTCRCTGTGTGPPGGCGPMRGALFPARAALTPYLRIGAGGGNRTRDSCLEGKGITIMQRPRSVCAVF